ncbi:M23 family metallopeptidase [uncultured Pseudoxanthomonas sp.]|uniref:M23 family metallopeptidase n=1 Tax=uncultured Pseudoxanthomonas sp. TaxID=281701 RepID=UPI0031BAE30A
MLALIVVVCTLAALLWTGVEISPTSPPVATPSASATLTDVGAAKLAIVASPDAPMTQLPSDPALPAPAAHTDPSGTLLIPVQGVQAPALVDTFTDARSQGRSHDAIDIMAPAGTPVLAVADGHIEKLFTSERGGLTIYQFDHAGRLAYYYAHLKGYAPGLAEQQQITRGQLLGYVGSTGNASPDAPHLHFAIFELGPEKRWWEGTALNPYPALTQSQ